MYFAYRTYIETLQCPLVVVLGITFRLNARNIWHWRKVALDRAKPLMVYWIEIYKVSIIIINKLANEAQTKHAYPLKNGLEL